MRLDYRLTVDDLREVLRPTTAAGRPRWRIAGLGRGALGWVMFLAMALLTVYLTTLDRPRGPAVPLPPAANLWVTLVPTLVPAGVVVLAVGVTSGRQRLRARQVTAAVAAGVPVPPPSPAPGWIGLLMVCPVLLLVVWDQPWAAVPWHPTPVAAVWAGLAPWGVAMLAVAGLNGGTKRAARQRWAITPGLHRPLWAEVSDDGLRASDGVCDTLYRWPAITRYRETQNLLVLTLEDARVLILPKRALANPAAEVELRGLVQTHVAQGTFLPREMAFPVLPVAAMAVPPAR